MLDLRMVNILNVLKRCSSVEKIMIVGSIVIIIAFGVVIFKGYIWTLPMAFNKLMNMLAFSGDVIEPMKMIEPSIVEKVIEPIVIFK